LPSSPIFPFDFNADLRRRRAFLILLPFMRDRLRAYLLVVDDVSLPNSSPFLTLRLPPNATNRGRARAARSPLGFPFFTFFIHTDRKEADKLFLALPQKGCDWRSVHTCSLLIEVWEQAFSPLKSPLSSARRSFFFRHLPEADQRVEKVFLFWPNHFPL